MNSWRSRWLQQASRKPSGKAAPVVRSKPDLVVDLWRNPEEAEPFLQRFYRRVEIDRHSYWLLTQSPNFDWKVVEAMATRRHRILRCEDQTPQCQISVSSLN
jgi:hypothetical protein